MKPHDARARRALRLACVVSALVPSGIRAQVRTPMDFNPLPTCRLWDTRNPVGPAGGLKLVANTTRCFPVTGSCGVPTRLRAVLVSASAVAATEPGTLRFFPLGQVPSPGFPTLRFKVGGLASADGLVVPLAGGSGICVRVEMSDGSVGTVHSMMDVTGFYGRS